MSGYNSAAAPLAPEKQTALQQMQDAKEEQVKAADVQLEFDDLTSKALEFYFGAMGCDDFNLTNRRAEVFRKLPEALRGDKDFVIQALQVNGTPRYVMLPACSEALRGDKDVMLAAIKGDCTGMDGSSLSWLYASDALKQDKGIALAAINPVVSGLSDHDFNCMGEVAVPFVFQQFPAALREDKDVIMAFLKNSYGGGKIQGDMKKWFLEKVPEKLKADKAVVMEAIAWQAALFEILPEDLKADKDVVLAAMKCGDYEAALPFFSEAMKADKDVVKTIEFNKFKAGQYERTCVEDTFSSEPFASFKETLCESSEACEAFKKSPEWLRGDKEYVLKVFDVHGYIKPYVILPACSEALRQDRDVMMKAAGLDGGFLLLLYASDAFKADKEFVMKALDHRDYDTLRCLKFVSPSLMEDKEVVMSVDTWGNHGKPANWFESVSEKLRGDKEVVLGVVKNCPRALEYASGALKEDKEICLAAGILRFASEAMKGDRDVVLCACRQDVCCDGEGCVNAFKSASEALKGDKEMVMIVTTEIDGSAFAFASDALKGDRDFVMQIISASSTGKGALEHASEALQADMELLEIAFEKTVVVISTDKPPPGLYDACWNASHGSFSSQIEVDASGGFQFSYDYEANLLNHNLDGEMWNSFKSMMVNITRYQEEYKSHEPTTFRLQKISGPFVHWKEEDTGSTIKWLYLGPKSESSVVCATASASVST